jgi:hypothetical protein
MSIEAGTKFLGLSSEVDTTERRSAQINKRSEHYTIEEITDHISLEVQGSIEIPEVTQVTADDIVGELDSANYDTIRSNVKGYKSTIISIPSFDLSDGSVVEVKYSEHEVSLTAFPIIQYDATYFAYTIPLNVVGSPSLGFGRAAIMPYGAGQSVFAGGVFVTAEIFDGGTDWLLYISVSDLNGNLLDDTSLVQFGLELEFRTY